MKCRCCISLRSAVYFGASIHVFLGALGFCIFLWQVFLYFVNSRRSEQASLSLISFFILLAGAIFLPLGCLIFRGVEKEKLRLIGWPMWTFLLVKIIEVGLKVIEESLLSHPQKRVDWTRRLYQGIDLTFSTLYFLLLFFYWRRLRAALRESNYFKTPPIDDHDATLTISSSTSKTKGKSNLKRFLDVDQNDP